MSNASAVAGLGFRVQGLGHKTWKLEVLPLRLGLQAFEKVSAVHPPVEVIAINRGIVAQWHCFRGKKIDFRSFQVICHINPRDSIV
jgi:hypothetical protein